MDRCSVTKTDSVCHYSKGVFWDAFRFILPSDLQCPYPHSRTKKTFLPAAFVSARASPKAGWGIRIGPRLDDPLLDCNGPPYNPQPAGRSQFLWVRTPFDRLSWKAADIVHFQSSSFHLQQKVNPGLAIAKLWMNYILQLSSHHLVGPSW